MALEGWVGWHGQGKTYNAVAHVLGRLDAEGIPLVCNAIVKGHVAAGHLLALDDAAAAASPDGRGLQQVELPRVVHFETWDDLMLVIARAIDRHWRLQLLIDEAGKFLSSRFFSKLDPRVLMVLQERRKIGAGLDLFWTAPSFDHVDKILRDVTQAVHACRRFGGSEYSHDGGRPPRAFLVRTYRPNEVGKANAKPLQRRLVPFAPELAGLYTTGIIGMSAPMAAAVNAAPDYREGGQADPSPAVVITGARGRKR